MTAVTITTPTEREIHAERIFDAPRDRVWTAFTDPTLIPEWWGPGTEVETMDVRTGGSWRFVTKAGGNESVSQGEYLEVTPPERIVQTFEIWGKVHTETFTFEDRGEQTHFTVTMRYDTTEERDQLIAYGGEKFMNAGYDRVDRLLEKLASA